MSQTVTIVVPALNEEKHLQACVENCAAIATQLGVEVEILIFNDGSTDSTGQIADEIAKGNSCVRSVHHDVPHGLGHCFKAGVSMSGCEYVGLLPGDNEIGKESVSDILQRVGTVDVVIPFTVNPEIRPPIRRVLSRAFSGFVRGLSGLPVRYFNGPVVYRTDLIREVLSDVSDGFAFQAEILCKLLSPAVTWVEVPMTINDRPKTTAFRWSSILDVARGLYHLHRTARRQKRERSVRTESH